VRQAVDRARRDADDLLWWCVTDGNRLRYDAEHIEAYKSLIEFPTLVTNLAASHKRSE
jgi:hypothetical protein